MEGARKAFLRTDMVWDLRKGLVIKDTLMTNYYCV
jgi:hypothetical protein